MSPRRSKVTDVRIEHPGRVTYRVDGFGTVATWPLLLIRLAWEAGADMEDLADGFGSGMGTMNDWSAIRDSSDEAKARMVGRAIEFFQDMAHGPRVQLNPQYSEAARGFISEEIPRLVQRGMPQRQAVAAALSQARRAGLKVPSANPGTLALINPRVRTGERFGWAQEIRYRHDEDGQYYRHTFQPENASLWAVSRWQVVIQGEHHPIIEEFA